MKMIRTLSTIVAILILFQLSWARGQKRTQPKRNRSVVPLIDSAKPAVFVSFLRAGEVEPLETGVGKNYLWFRMTNNTRWPIWLEMSGVPKEYGDTGLYYTIEDKEDGKIQIDSRCHVCSVNPLDARRSITFSIPGDYARADSRLRIEYSFQWERDSETIGGSYSTHSVEFYFSYLPKSAQTSKGLSNNVSDRRRRSAIRMVLPVPFGGPVNTGVMPHNAENSIMQDRFLMTPEEFEIGVRELLKAMHNNDIAPQPPKRSSYGSRDAVRRAGDVERYAE